MRIFPTTTMNRCSVLMAIPILMWIPWNAVQGRDFLIAIHRKSYQSSSEIEAYEKETGGMMQVQYPNYKFKRSYRVYYSQSFVIDEKMGTSSGIEFNSILLTCSNSQTKIFVHSDNNRYNIFSPLPVTSLGKRYIVSSCDRSGQYRPFLVIAAHKEKTDVDITFNITGSVRYEGRTYQDGDTLSLTLGTCQTFTMESWSDLSGTVINSTHTIALFTGLLNNTAVVAYDQLLPVEHYSTEYVVAVDDNTTPYNLQIISESNKTMITFSNGTAVSVDGCGLYRRNLQQNETFYFTSNKPVMTTLCRSNAECSGFVIIPPVSYYPKQTNLVVETFLNTIILLTARDTEPDIPSWAVSKQWRHIPNSLYKVGEFRPKHSYSRITTGNAFIGALLFYQNYSIYNDGISTEDITPNYDDMTSYILAVPSHAHVYLAAVGMNDGFWQVQFPHRQELYSRQSTPYTADYFYIDYKMGTIRGIENKTILVNAQSNDLRITCYSEFDEIISFSPLPVSALGRKYLIPSSYYPYVNDSELMIATANDPTVASITFRLEDQSLYFDGKTYSDGDTMRVTLQEYQTLTIPSTVSLCGTVVASDRSVAVFIRTNSGNYDASFHQLFPVNMCGQEFVAALHEPDHLYGRYPNQYHLRIMSEHNDTKIIFNDNETAFVGERNCYLKYLNINEPIFFTTSLPVMSSLCMYTNESFPFDETQYGCTILPPRSFHAYSTFFVLTKYSGFTIMTEKTTNNLKVTRSVGRSWKETIVIEWRDIPNSNYKVGTSRSWFETSTIFVSANSQFTILGYGTDYHVQTLFSEGYNFHKMSTNITTVTGYGQETPLSMTESSIQDKTSDRSSSYPGEQPTNPSTTGSHIQDTGFISRSDATESFAHLAVTLTCGFIILVLVIVIAGLII